MSLEESILMAGKLGIKIKHGLTVRDIPLLSLAPPKADKLGSVTPSLIGVVLLPLPGSGGIFSFSGLSKEKTKYNKITVDGLTSRRYRE